MKPQKKLNIRACRIFLIPFLLLLASFWLGGCSSEQQAKEDVPLVRTLTIKSDEGNKKSVYPGEVCGRNETQLAFQVGGRIIKRNVETGQMVGPGDIIMEIETRDLQQGVVTIEAQLKSAETDLQLAEENLKRYKALFESKVISKADLILAKDTKARDELRQELDELFDREFENVRMKTKVLALGPGLAYPVMLRVSGYDRGKVREIASQARDVMVQNPNLLNINFNWFEKTKTMRLHIDQDKARALGIDKQSLAVALQSQLSGITIAEFREGDRKIDIVYRAADLDPNDLSRVKDLSVAAFNGKFVPLEQIAEISYDAEEGAVWRRNLKPTITVQADTVPGITGNDATIQAYKDLEELRNNLPPGYSIEMGGSVDLRDEAIGLLMQPVPAMVIIIMTLLMLQLQNMFYKDEQK